MLQGVVCGVVAQGTAKEPCGGLVISFLAGQILTSNTRALRTHVVSHDGTELHLLHVAALLPPQARLEHLEKALVTWRLIRRTASKSFEDCMPNSERSPQATISIRALGTDVVQLSWGLGSFREPCFRQTSATALRAERVNSRACRHAGKFSAMVNVIPATIP